MFSLKCSGERLRVHHRQGLHGEGGPEDGAPHPGGSGLRVWPTSSSSLPTQSFQGTGRGLKLSGNRFRGHQVVHVGAVPSTS